MPKIYDLSPKSVNDPAHKSSHQPERDGAGPCGEPPDSEALRAAILKTFALAHAHAEALLSEPAGAVGENHQVIAELVEAAARDALARFETEWGQR